MESTPDVSEQMDCRTESLIKPQRDSLLLGSFLCVVMKGSEWRLSLLHVEIEK